MALTITAIGSFGDTPCSASLTITTISATAELARSLAFLASSLFVAGVSHR